MKILNYSNVSFVLIPKGMTPECQPLEMSVNKKFKDNIALIFEHNRLFYDKLNSKIKLKTARLNIVDFIHTVWEDDNLITKDDIIKGFIHAGIIDNSYLSYDEEKINKGYICDLFYVENSTILDDLGDELNINEFNTENNTDDDEEEKEKEIKKIQEKYYIKKVLKMKWI